MLASVHAPPHEGSISDTLIPMSGAVSASWSQGGGYSSLDPNPPTSVQIDMTSFEVYPDLMRSFNVDVGIAAAGTPSAAYGAAGATGVWNSILGGASALVDTQGRTTGATATLAPATESGWIGGPSDDFSLMGDHVQHCALNRSWTLDFAGLPNGHYELFVYGPASSAVQTGDVDVTTASSTFTIANVAGNTSATLVEGESWRSAPVHVTDGTLGLFGEFALAACGGIAGVQLVALDSGIPPVPALGATARALALVALLLVALRGARSATAPT